MTIDIVAWDRLGDFPCPMLHICAPRGIASPTVAWTFWCATKDLRLMISVEHVWRFGGLRRFCVGAHVRGALFCGHHIKPCKIKTVVFTILMCACVFATFPAHVRIFILEAKHVCCVNCCVCTSGVCLSTLCLPTLVVCL